MNFTSTPFAFLLFFLVLILSFVRSQTVRKVILLGTCFTFYSYWEWRLVVLLSFFILTNFFFTILIKRTESPKIQNIIAVLGIILNLIFLGFFKYFNFFIDNLNTILIGTNINLQTLSILLPLGISFYSFEAISYLIDIKRKTIHPSHSLLDYALYISYFPRIVSGPIQRAPDFFSQLNRGIYLSLPNLIVGGQLILRGMLKKLVIADNLGIMTNEIFGAPSIFASASTWVAVFAYSIQILFDFSGYTDMAIGISKIIGIDLPQNFNLPYTSQSVTEFWRRWHITLSTWFRDYVFFPMEISRVRKNRPQFLQLFNILIIFLLTGIWHGASWNFVLWGMLHGVSIVIERIFHKSQNIKHPLNSFKAWGQSLLTFVLITLFWIPFRSPDWVTTIIIIKKLLFVDTTYQIEWYNIWALISVPLIIFGGMVVRRFQWRWPILPYQKPYTPAFMLCEALIIFFFSPLNSSPFIYFQF